MSLKDLIAKVKLDTDEAKAAIDDLHTHMVRSFDAQEQYAKSINSLMTQGFLTQAEGTKILDKLAAGETHLEKALISRMGLAKMTSRVFETATKRWMAIESAAVRQIGVEAEITQRKLIGMSAAKSSSPPASGGGGSGGGGVNFVRVAATAGQLAVLGRVNVTMKSVSSTLRSVSASSAATATSMDRFRMALAAPKVNPAFNLVKIGIEALTGKTAGLVDLVRKTSDAVGTGLPASLGAAVDGLGKIVGALDNSQLTVSKWISKLEGMSNGLKLFNAVFPTATGTASRFGSIIAFALPKLARLSGLIQQGSETTGRWTNAAREMQQMLTGTFQKTGTTADIFARSIYHANLPMRLLTREVQGAERVMKVAKFAAYALSSPFHSVALAVHHSTANWRQLQNELPKLQNSTGIVKTSLGAATATLRQIDFAARYAGASFTDLAAKVVASSPVAAKGVMGVASAMATVQRTATAVKTQVNERLFAPLRNGFNLIKQVSAPAVAEMKRVTAIIGKDLSRDLSRAKAAIGGYVRSWELGTRAHRLVSQSTYVISSIMRPLIPVVKGVASAAMFLTGKLVGLVGPGRMASASLGGLKSAASGAASAMSRTAGSGFSAVGRGAGMAKMATAGLLAGMVALGTSTAVATEKNSAVFGTMLHDMEQGKAVVGSLQKTEAAKFFDNQELLDSGRLLFKAGVSAADLSGKTNQFAKIAAATSTEIGDLARIYQQGANAGSFGQDKINQYAERGIAIYDGLKVATGKSGAELQKMISDGKIGTAEMDAALAHLTEGHGIYADSLTNLGNTTAGKFSIIKNTITQSLGRVMGVALEILAPFGSALVMITEQVAGAFESFRPHIMYAAVAGAWFFGNIVDLGRFAWATMSLFAVTAFNDIIYFFTDKIPAYLSWFSANWKNVFVDAGNLILTVFSNIASNIGTAMRAIWDYIASGGTAELKFAFVPLLDGFKATVSELPNIPDRAMTDLEKSLQAQTEGIGLKLSDNFDAMLKEAEGKMSKQAPELSKDAGKAAADGAGTATDEAAKNASKKMAENKAAQINSSEGQSVVAQMLKGLKGDDDKNAKKAAIKSEKHLEKLARNSDRGKPLAAREWKA